MFKLINKIVNMSFENGLLHITTEEDQKIPSIIKYSKHNERHFIFYNCKLIDRKIQTGFSKMKTLYTHFKYEISYEKKFTSKFISKVNSDFRIYIRDKKIDLIL